MPKSLADLKMPKKFSKLKLYDLFIILIIIFTFIIMSAPQSRLPEILIISGAEIDSESKQILLTHEEELSLSKKRELELQIENTLNPLFDSVQIVSNLVFDWNQNQVKTSTYSSPVPNSELGLIGSAGTEQNDYIYNESESIVASGSGGLVAEESSMLITVYKYKNYTKKSADDDDLLQGRSWEQFKNETEIKRLTIDRELVENISRGVGIENILIIGFEVPVFEEPEEITLSPKNLAIAAALIMFVVVLTYIITKPQLSETKLTKETESESIETKEVESSKKEIETKEIEIKEINSTVSISEKNEINKMQVQPEYRDSEVKIQIENFAEKKPEAVAQLLRNWLIDEWELR